MRLIDAEALVRRAIERHKRAMGASVGHGMGVITNMIYDAPTIDAVPVVHGRWECVNESENVWMCSGENGCENEILLLEGTPTENQWDFCPHCGAKMDGGAEDAEE